ncbi:MAG: CapA family protein [Clostridia bacterium]|nr:CapA family protein [Clostridia bacterium]
MLKLTVIGDIMVEPDFLKQVENDGKYDFYPPLAPLESILSDSDYVIGNLETPLAGEDAVYTNRIVSFNAPDSVAEAVKRIGVDAVSTANNHCLDRGFEGLERTLDVLDRVGLSHTGTYKRGFSGDRNLYFEIDGTRFALIAYAHSTNYGISTALPEGESAVCVNNSRPLKGGAPTYKRLPESYYTTLKYVEELTGRRLLWEETIMLRKMMGISIGATDALVPPREEIDEYIQKITADYKRARENADIVIFYQHMGGQFNTTPGDYSKAFLARCAEIGFDAIFTAHSHTTQMAEYINGTPCFYSMGNVTMSPCTFYQIPESLAEYGLAAHLYLEQKRIDKITISIIKMVEDENTPLRVIPVDKLYGMLSGQEREKLVAEVGEVYTRVTGKPLPSEPLLKEYDL